MQSTETLQDSRRKPITLTQPLSQAVSIIIPTFNEAENIAELLLRIHQAFTEAALPYEAIIVDDHSTDATRAVARAVAKEHDLPVRVLSKRGQPGKAFSLLEGFAAAQFALLAMIDGDLQYPPEALPDMIRATEHADIIIADRRPTYCSADRVRSWLSTAFTAVITMLFGIDTDIQSGLKVFRRTIYEHGVQSCAGSWNLDLYLVTHAFFHGYTLTNIPIAFQKRKAGVSKVRPLQVGLELLWTAFQVKAQRMADIMMQHRVFRGRHSPSSQKSGLLSAYFLADARDQGTDDPFSDAFAPVYLQQATSARWQRKTVQPHPVPASDTREEAELCVVTAPHTYSDEKHTQG